MIEVFLNKNRPTTPGRRGFVNLITPDLYKGDPFKNLTKQ